MATTWNLAGRDDVLGAVATTLRAGTGACLIGPAGVGKTRIVDELACWAELSGRRVLRLHTTIGAGELPLAPFLQLFAAREPSDEPSEAGTGGTGGAGGAGRAGTARSNGPLASFEHTFARIAEHIRRDGAEGTPVLVAVDDMDLLDDASTVLIHQLVSAGDAVLLAAMRSDRLAPPVLVNLLQDGSVRRVDVGPLGRAEAAAVAEAVAGTALDADSHERLWNVTQGNALFIHELLTAAAERGRIVSGIDGAHLGPLPLGAPRLMDVLKGRVARLGPDLERALVHLAFAEPCGPAELASVADAATLAALERAHLVRADVDGKRLSLRLAHPLYGEVLRAGTGHLQRRAVLATLAGDLHATGARRTGDIVKLARLAVDGGVDADPALLQRATSVAYHSGDLVLCERIGRRAWEQSHEFRLGWNLMNCLVAIGDVEPAARHLAEWRRYATRPSQRLAVGIAESLYEFWLHADADAATAAVESALAEAGGDEPDPPVPTVTRNEVVANHAIQLALRRRPDRALQLAEPLLADPSPQVRIRASLAVADARRASARPLSAIAVLDEAHRLFAEIGQHSISLSERFFFTFRAICLLQIGDLEGAREAARRARRDTADVVHSALALAVAAAIDVTAGRTVSALEAIEHADIVYGPSNHSGVARRWIVSILALVRATAGDDAGTERALAQFDADTHPAAAFDLAATLARSRLHARQGRPDAACAVLRAAGDDARRRGDRSAEVLFCYELVRLDRAAEVVDRMEELAVAAEGPMFSVMARQARGAADGDVATLGDIAELLAAGDMPLYASEAAAQAGAAARRLGDHRAATGWAARASELRLRCETVVSPVPIADIGTNVLTRREREIAVLAAEHVSSRQIAERLFISRRTVENHLARVYEKLGVRSRAQLAARLEGRAEGAVAATP